MLEGFSDVRMAAVRIAGVEEAQAVVVAVEKQVREALCSESGLVRTVADANRAGAHGQAARLNAGLAEGDSVRGAELARESGKSERPREGAGVNPGSTSGASSAMDKIAAFHAASLRAAFQKAVYLTNGRAKRTLV
jgi:hypothetical protein